MLVVASTHVASTTTPTVSTLRPASAPFEPPRAERAAARLRSPSTNPPRVDRYSLPSPVSPPSRLPPSPPSSPICRPATLHPPSATVPRKLERAPPFDPADSHPPRPSVEPPDRHPPIRRPNSILYGLQVSPSRLPTPAHRASSTKPSSRHLSAVSFSATRVTTTFLSSDTPSPSLTPFRSGMRLSSLSFSRMLLSPRRVPADKYATGGPRDPSTHVRGHEATGLKFLSLEVLVCTVLTGCTALTRCKV